MWWRIPVLGLLALGALSACGPGERAVPPPPTPTPAPTPPPASSLSEEAAALCEAGDSKQAGSGTYAVPVLSLLRRDYDDGPWSLHGLPHVEATSAPEVGALACITESRTRAGQYRGGAPAYRRVWNLEVVRWPEGGVLGRSRFEGGPPPFLAKEGEPGYGGEPGAEAAAWLVRDDASRPVFAHARGVTSLAFSPDGRLLAVGHQYHREYNMENGGVSLWDVGRRRLQRSFADDKFAGGGVHDLLFSSDGGSLITSGGRVVVWNPVSGSRRRSFGGDTDSETCVALSPDAQLLAACSKNGARLWDMSTRKERPPLTATGAVRALAFSPDGRLLAIGSAGPLVLWDLAAGHAVPASAAPVNVSEIAFSPGSGLAVGDPKGNVRLWAPGSGVLWSVVGHAGAVNAVAFSPDGQTLATGGADAAVRVWSADGGRPVQTLSGHAADVRALAFHPDGSILASGSLDRTVRLWKLGS